MQTVDECIYVMTSLDKSIADIDQQIREAKAHFALTHDRSNDAWYSTAIYSLKAARRCRVIAQERRGQLSEIARNARHIEDQLRFEQCFMRAARNLLDETTYHALWNEANRVREERSRELGVDHGSPV